MSSRVSPGTRLREVERAVIQATAAVGRAVTIVEIRTAHAELYEDLDPRAIARAIVRLERAGTIAKVGGRLRRTRWAHLAHPVRVGDPEDVAPMLVEIVESLCRALGRPLETREVNAELVRRGVEGLSNDQVRTRLESLAHASERKAQRAAAEWSGPRVLRIAGVTRGGRACVSWAPLEPIAAPAVFRDESDAIRHAVACAGTALGQPAAAQEVELWARAELLPSRGEVRAGSPEAELDRAAAEAVQANRFRQRLAGALGVDKQRRGREGRLRAVRTPLTSRGAYPLRYAATAVSPQQMAACLVEDLSRLLQPRSELDGVARVREEAALVGSALLEEIADAREAALASALLRGVGEPGLEPLLLAEACTLAQRAAEVAHGWAYSTRARGRHAPPEPDMEVAAFLDLLPRLACLAARGGGLRTLEQVEGVRIAELEALGREALELGDRGARYWSPLITRARRLRGPVRGGNSCTDPSETESLLDRPDVMQRLVAAAYLPTLSALVGSACDLLGGVLRDADAVRDWLSRVERGDAGVRHGLVVALGLLGVPAPIALAWPDPGDPEGAAAYLASVALGVDDAEARVRLAEDADLSARGAATEITGRALERLQAGGRLSVVD